jgi:hypothetical protein
MNVVPITLREANDFVEAFHRHSGRTSRDGGKFAIGASEEGFLVGVASVGRPVARLLNDSFTAEVLRLCVAKNAPKGACSFLYGASLRGAGWRVVAQVRPDSWAREKRERRWQPVYRQQKLRWRDGRKGGMNDILRIIHGTLYLRLHCRIQN